MDEISPQKFERFFRSEIQVCFNWVRFFDEGWPVRLGIVAGDAALKTLYPPWYVSRNTGDEVSYICGDAEPFAFDEIPAILSQLDGGRQTKITELAREFAKSEKPVRLVLPAYDVKNGRLLILDGNHRLAAVSKVSSAFALLAFVVHGPIDGQALPDLKHW